MSCIHKHRTHLRTHTGSNLHTITHICTCNTHTHTLTTCVYTYVYIHTYMCMDAWTWTEHDRDGGEQAMSRGEGGRSGKEVRERGEGVARREGREGKE